jgi:hypothetical protein
MKELAWRRTSRAIKRQRRYLDFERMTQSNNYKTLKGLSFVCSLTALAAKRIEIKKRNRIFIIELGGNKSILSWIWHFRESSLKSIFPSLTATCLSSKFAHVPIAIDYSYGGPHRNRGLLLCKELCRDHSASLAAYCTSPEQEPWKKCSWHVNWSDWPPAAPQQASVPWLSLQLWEVGLNRVGT